jgi:hypothetical protein
MKALGNWLVIIGVFSIVVAVICFAISETTVAYSGENYQYFLSGISLGFIGFILIGLGRLMNGFFG